MTRRQLLGVALLITLAASWWASEIDENPDSPSSPRKAAHRLPAPMSTERIDLARLNARPTADVAGRSSDLPRAVVANLFPVVSFEPPPPPPSVQKPVAPPLPFRYSGMLEDSGNTLVFLADGAQMRTVRAGDLLDGRYRVTAVTRSRIDFIYLPLNESQSLATGNLP